MGDARELEIAASPVDGALPRVVSLDDVRAVDPTLAGGKASALAAARRRGLRTLDGGVLSTAFAADVDGGAAISAHPAMQEVFALVGGATRALVARSSSPLEDTAMSSMAGQFESVIGIDGFDEFVTAVAGLPEALVSGAVDGSRTVVDAGGSVLEHDQRDGPTLLPTVLRPLTALAASAAEIFGGPQDVEWAIDHEEQLWLLQSRPVTTEVRGVPAGPIFGPGPVAETFPEPLAPLEVDLWVPSLRDAIRDALQLAGAATAVQVAASPIVAVIDGNVAVDLQLTGEIRMRPRLLQKLNPIPGARRLRSAWRVGRLRGALTGLAEDLLDRVDADLEAVPAVEELTSRQVLALVARSQEMLKALHGHEVLMGLLTDAGESRLTGASVALRVGRSSTGRGRRRRHQDAEPRRARTHRAACRT